jgi:hypothetical protein
VVAPQLPPGETWGGSWYGGETAAQRWLVTLTRALTARRSVDPRRVYGVGFSMGAIGLWDILVRQPDLFAAAALIAGDLDVTAASSLVGFPLWAVRGGRDTLVPPQNARAFAALATARWCPRPRRCPAGSLRVPRQQHRTTCRQAVHAREVCVQPRGPLCRVAVVVSEATGVVCPVDPPAAQRRAVRARADRVRRDDTDAWTADDAGGRGPGRAAPAPPRESPGRRAPGHRRDASKVALTAQ